MAGMLMSCEKAGDGEGVVTLKAPVWIELALRIRTWSVSYKEAPSPEWPVQRHASSSPAPADSRWHLLSHPKSLHASPPETKPNQHPPFSSRAIRPRAHSAFLLRTFFPNPPLSGRPAEKFISHVSFDRSHVIGGPMRKFKTH
jgi:hypothetical protein